MNVMYLCYNYCAPCHVCEIFPGWNKFMKNPAMEVSLCVYIRWVLCQHAIKYHSSAIIVSTTVACISKSFLTKKIQVKIHVSEKEDLLT